MVDAWWIDIQGQIIDVLDTHEDIIFDNPKKFNMSLEDINNTRRPQDDTDESELSELAIKKGNIRIRLFEKSVITGLFIEYDSATCKNFADKLINFIYDKILTRPNNLLNFKTNIYDFAVNKTSKQPLNILLSTLEDERLFESSKQYLLKSEDKKEINKNIKQLEKDNLKELEMINLKKNNQETTNKLEKLIKEQAITFYKDTSKLTVEEGGLYRIELKRNLNINIYNVTIVLYDMNSSKEESDLIRLIYNKLKGNIIEKMRDRDITVSFYMAASNKDPENMINYIEKQLISTFKFE